MEYKTNVGVLLKNISDAIETSANLELSDFAAAQHETDRLLTGYGFIAVL